MARRKWKAGRADEAQAPSFLRRYRKPLVIAAIALAAIALFIYRFNNSKYQYGDARSDYNRALADCIRDRTRVSGEGGALEDAADACVRDTPAPQGAERK